MSNLNHLFITSKECEPSFPIHFIASSKSFTLSSNFNSFNLLPSFCIHYYLLLILFHVIRIIFSSNILKVLIQAEYDEKYKRKWSSRISFNSLGYSFFNSIIWIDWYKIFKIYSFSGNSISLPFFIVVTICKILFVNKDIISAQSGFDLHLIVLQ